jgi:hypothetical protein
MANISIIFKKNEGPFPYLDESLAIFYLYFVFSVKNEGFVADFIF